MFAALQVHPWAYPALEVVHIAGIALLLGNLVMLELRVFGRAEAERSYRFVATRRDQAGKVREQVVQFTPTTSRHIFFTQRQGRSAG